MDGIETRISVPRASFGRAEPGARVPSRPLSPEFLSSIPPPPIPKTLETRRVIAVTFSLMGRNTVLFLALVAAAAAPERIVYHIIGGNTLGALLLLDSLTTLSCVPLYTAVFSGALADLRGKTLSFNDCLMAARNAPRDANILAAVTSLSVVLLLIVPGIALASRWAVAAPVALVEGEDWDIAMARSSLLTRECRAQVRVLVLLLAGLAISRALAMEPVWGMDPEAVLAFLWGNWLIPLLLTAFTAAATAVLYHMLAGQGATDGTQA